jgi:hypothetical protein
MYVVMVAYVSRIVLVCFECGVGGGRVGGEVGVRVIRKVKVRVNALCKRCLKGKIPGKLRHC